MNNLIVIGELKIVLNAFQQTSYQAQTNLLG